MQTISGFKELQAALGELPKATQKNVLKRTLNKGADPVEAAAKAAAPEESGTLHREIHVGTQLTRRQRSSAYRPVNGNGFVEVHIGTALGRGMFTNFGTFKDRPQFWFDHAWAATQNQSLQIIQSDLGTEIEKAAARLRKKGKL